MVMNCLFEYHNIMKRYILDRSLAWTRAVSLSALLSSCLSEA